MSLSQPMTRNLPSADNCTVNGAAFADGLQSALDAVVHISIGSGLREVRCTGWLITPRLVVLPAYAFAGEERQDAPIRVSLRRPGAQGWEDHADGETPSERLRADFPSDSPGDTDLVILRLATPHSAPRLVYRRDALDPGELVLMAYHGQPNPELVGPSLSFSELEHFNDWTLQYRGSKPSGSGGAAIYDIHWRFLGLHLMSTEAGASGPVQAAVMAMLQRSRWWSEIAHYQSLADVVAVRQSVSPSVQAPVPISPALIRAALSFSVSRDALAPADREALASHVVDPDAPHWTLIPSVRRTLLASSPFDVLVKFLPVEIDAPEQRVIAPILRGGAYNIEQANEDDLAHWLQAVRWFRGLAPGLPTAAHVFHLLQRRRIRGRLDRIAGQDFVGRAGELALMRRWFDSRDPAPLNIRGIGGVGKSALVAHFLASLPAETMLLWLDFDRADLAPDDASSVIAALREQVGVQLVAVEGTTQSDASRVPGSLEVHDELDAARDVLLRMLAGEVGRRILIVLDSFEAAQFAERYQELWPELEALAQRVAGIQVIISGRARVPNLRFLGEPAKEIPLLGLDPGEARAWLGRHGISPGLVQNEVVRVAAGLPLVLKLAEHLAKAGGKLDDLPQNLPEQMIAGVLYDRIINRVHDPQFRDFAKGAIVLRRLSAEMVAEVFSGLPLALPTGPSEVWFREFARESALVEGQEELFLRPEVRAAALGLLERQQPDLVRELDRRALAWYNTRDPNDPIVAAERVYHFLRLNDEAGAMAAWRDGCAPYLQYAEDTLHGAAKDWLSRRLGTSASIFGGATEVWELEAAGRIVKSRAAGLPDSTSGVFDERAERSVGGALAFHEGYESWISGQRDAALTHLLRHGIENTDPKSRDRAMLAALIYAERGEVGTALSILQGWSAREKWCDRKDGQVERAAVHAARVCLLAPLALEDHFVEYAVWPHGVFAMDLLRDEARAYASLAGSPASAVGIQLPLHESKRDEFLASLKEFRAITNVLGVWNRNMLSDSRRLTPDPNTAPTLLHASWERWSVLAEGCMVKVLNDSLEFSAVNPLNRSVIIVLSLFAAVPRLELQLHGFALEAVLNIMESRLFPLSSASRSTQSGKSFSSPSLPTDVVALRRLALQWCGPDLRPLRQLVQRFAGQPEEA